MRRKLFGATVLTALAAALLFGGSASSSSDRTLATINIRTLNIANALPLDLGIQNAIKRAYRKRKVSPKDVLRIGAKWTPYSSVASWYLWRSLDNGAGQAAPSRVPRRRSS